MRIGVLEAGGTKMVCAVGDENGQILERVSIATGKPEETMPDILEFFHQYSLDAIGIGTFGPVDLDRTSPTYGYIMSTPKIPWRNFDLLGCIKKEFASNRTGYRRKCLCNRRSYLWSYQRIGQQHLYNGRNRYRCGSDSGRQSGAWYAASRSRTYIAE